MAGCSCVDFSRLNNHRRTLDQVGESRDTFQSLVHYADQYRPKIIVLENVSGCEWGQVQSRMQDINYAAEFVKRDDIANLFQSVKQLAGTTVASEMHPYIAMIIGAFNHIVLINVEYHMYSRFLTFTTTGR